ncbi:Syncytin-1 [Sciurus carolinensis]|uniref:Syncytin-1 n=1 Tax=Sciurus carolinensis TaxID=30640 RepID=A0AA41N5G0_SCICA|nr:Syncytin-1 [Sciurus carolinensis]
MRSLNPNICGKNVAIPAANTPLCAPNGTVFYCGGPASNVLPGNWTGICALALLFPEVTIIPNNQSLPIPSMEQSNPRAKRAILGIGVATGVGTGVSGISMSLALYNKLSQQIIDDMQYVANTILDLQVQLDSLATVVLQNHCGLDLLMVKKGRLCLFLGEECCFYANCSGIVQDKIKTLQEDLERRRSELHSNFFWTGLHQWLPYLLPLMGLLITIILVFTFGPCIINKPIHFLKSQAKSVQLMVVRQHYTTLHDDDWEPYRIMDHSYQDTGV